MDEIWCLQCSACQEHTFYGVSERDVYVEPPSELHRPGLVAKLIKTMYGTQDASNAWQKLWGEHFRSNGFELVAKQSSVVQIRACEWILPWRRFCDCGSRRSNRELWKTVAREVRYETDRHDRCSRTLGQRTGNVAQICQSDQ